MLPRSKVYQSTVSIKLKQFSGYVQDIRYLILSLTKRDLRVIKQINSISIFSTFSFLFKALVSFSCKPLKNVFYLGRLRTKIKKFNRTTLYLVSSKTSTSKTPPHFAQAKTCSLTTPNAMALNVRGFFV